MSRPSAPPADDIDCSIAATLEVIGDRWTLLILRDVFRGVRRFGRLHEDLGIAKNILSDRLGRLVDAGVLEQCLYQERPPRYEYRLTPKGMDLSPALVALMHWGDRWYAREGPPTVLVHDECGTPLEQVTRCPRCLEEISPVNIGSRPGRTGDRVATATPPGARGPQHRTGGTVRTDQETHQHRTGAAMRTEQERT